MEGALLLLLGPPTWIFFPALSVFLVLVAVGTWWATKP